MITRRADCEIDGFRAIELANDAISLVVVPDLGAKIVSLRNVASGREWCWHPGDKRELFANDYGVSFGDSTHVGIDECFPTIEECAWNGRSLPCHGEVWSMPWQVTGGSQQDGIATHVRLRESPFSLDRRVSLSGNTVSLDYTVRNVSDSAECYIWALHPLFKVGLGDRLILPAEVNHLAVGASKGFPEDAPIVNWPSPAAGFYLDRFDLGENKTSRLKAFTELLEDGVVYISNEDSGDCLKMSWDTRRNPYLGIWMTRGGYRGLHYITALEPTNAPSDSLASAKPSEHIILPGNEQRSWRVDIQLG